MSRSAIYAGTFDPITNGHRDIIERAVKVFDRVLVAVAKDSPKSSLFSTEDRVEMIRENTADLGDRVSVESFSGLLVEYARKRGVKVIIRGLRAVSDYEYESQMAVINRQLDEEVETVFLMTSKRSSFISSSVVRQIASVGGDVSSLVPENVARRMKEVYSKMAESS